MNLLAVIQFENIKEKKKTYYLGAPIIEYIVRKKHIDSAGYACSPVNSYRTTRRKTTTRNYK